MDNDRTSVTVNVMIAQSEPIEAKALDVGLTSEFIIVHIGTDREVALFFDNWQHLADFGNDLLNAANAAMSLEPGWVQT